MRCTISRLSQFYVKAAQIKSNVNNGKRKYTNVAEKQNRQLSSGRLKFNHLLVMLAQTKLQNSNYVWQPVRKFKARHKENPA